MASAICVAVGLVLLAVILANVSGEALLAGLLVWWAVGILITRWAWEVFVGRAKGSTWKWAWAAALGMLWPLWALLAVCVLAGEKLGDRP